MVGRILAFSTIVLLSSASFTMNAQASDFHSPRTAALGGAGHAGPMLNDAIYLNPSYVSFLPAYSIGAIWSWFYGGLYTGQNTLPVEFKGRNFNLSIQDGRTELFQAGVGYTVREDGSYIHIGASKGFIQRLGFGLGLKLAFPTNGLQEARDINFSTTGMIMPWVQASLLIDNILETEEGAALGLHREVVLGTKFNLMEIAMFYLDPHWVPSLAEDQRWGYELGLEITLFKDLFLRFGHFDNATIPYMNNVRGYGFGFGVGWMGPKLNVEYGMGRVLSAKTTYPAATYHSLGMNVFF